MAIFFFLTIVCGFIYRSKTDLIKSSTLSSYKKLGLLVESSVENAESIKATNSSWKFQNRWNSLQMMELKMNF